MGAQRHSTASDRHGQRWHTGFLAVQSLTNDRSTTVTRLMVAAVKGAGRGDLQPTRRVEQDGAGCGSEVVVTEVVLLR